MTQKKKHEEFWSKGNECLLKFSPFPTERTSTADDEDESSTSSHRYIVVAQQKSACDTSKVIYH